MRYIHYCGLLVIGWLLCTVYGIGYAQPVHTGDLPPEVKALLQALRGERKDSTGTSQLAPSPGTTEGYDAGSATPDGYEQTLVRYLRLRELAAQTVADHATELERQLHALETQLAEAAAQPPHPQAEEETGEALSAEHVAEGSAAQQLARLCRRRAQPFLQDYEHITQQLEEIAASSRAMAQRLRNLLR